MFDPFDNAIAEARENGSASAYGNRHALLASIEPMVDSLLQRTLTGAQPEPGDRQDLIAAALEGATEALGQLAQTYTDSALMARELVERYGPDWEAHFEQIGGQFGPRSEGAPRE